MTIIITFFNWERKTHYLKLRLFLGLLMRIRSTLFILVTNLFKTVRLKYIDSAGKTDFLK